MAYLATDTLISSIRNWATGYMLLIFFYDSNSRVDKIEGRSNTILAAVFNTVFIFSNNYFKK